MTSTLELSEKCAVAVTNVVARTVVFQSGGSTVTDTRVTGVGVVTDDYLTRSETSITIFARAFGYATQGTRDIIVTNADGKSATLRAGLTIQ